MNELDVILADKGELRNMLLGTDEDVLLVLQTRKADVVNMLVESGREERVRVFSRRLPCLLLVQLYLVVMWLAALRRKCERVRSGV